MTGEFELHHQEDAALLIDWENIKSSLSSHDLRPSVAAIRDACSRFGRIVLARAYADWQDPWLRQDPRDLYAAGIEPVYVPVRRYDESDGSTTVKNSVDVRLASDCIELIHTHPGIAVYILATGDSDFIHVVNKLRPYGKRVVGLAVSWSASPRLAELVDELVLYDRDIEPPTEVLATPPSPTPQRAPVASAAVRAVATAEGMSEDDARSVVAAILQALRTYREAGRPLNISGLGLELRTQLGDHRFRILVRGRLQRIVRELARFGELKTDQRGVDDWLYLPSEDVAPIASPAPTPTAPTYRTLVSWSEITPSLRQKSLASVIRLESDPRLDWLVFNRIAQELDGLDDELSGREIANAMVTAGLIRQHEQKEWYDALTGRTGEYWTLALNDDHPEVQAVRRSLATDGAPS